MNVEITPNVPVDLLVAAGIAVGTPVEIVAITQNTVKVFNTATTPNIVTDDFLPCIYGAQKVLGQATDLGLWGYSRDGGLIDIKEVT